MLALLLAVGMVTTTPENPTYQVRLDIIRGTDTVSTTFVMPEGIEGRALIEAKNAFTRVRVRVTKSERPGCRNVVLGAVTRATLALVDSATLEPVPLIIICDAATARVAVDAGPLYQITVREVDAPTTPADTMPASVVQRFVDAANARDAKTMAALVSTDAVFLRFPGGQVMAASRDSIHAHYVRSLSGVPPAFHITVSPRIVEGQLVIDQEHFAGVTSGRTSATWMYLVRGGLITKAWALDPNPK